LFEAMALLLRAAPCVLRCLLLRLQLRAALGVLGRALSLLGGLFLRRKLGRQLGFAADLPRAPRVVLLIAPVAGAGDRQGRGGDHRGHFPRRA
jgi:hypothetical protein